MSALVPLHFENADIRMIMQDSEPWWVLNDVCAALEIRNPRDAANRLEDYQKGVGITDTLGGPQEFLIVNEPGVYALTVRSRKPEAKQFARWLFTEVIPSIRKFGSFPPPPAIEIEAMPKPDPLQAPHWSSIGTRFLEEAERIAAEEGYETDVFLGRLMTKARIRVLREHGEGVRALLNDEKKREAIIGIGFDMRYVQMGLKTFTREERALHRQMRALDSRQRAAAFGHLMTQLPALAGPPADEIENS